MLEKQAKNLIRKKDLSLCARVRVCVGGCVLAYLSTTLAGMQLLPWQQSKGLVHKITHLSPSIISYVCVIFF